MYLLCMQHSGEDRSINRKGLYLKHEISSSMGRTPDTLTPILRWICEPCYLQPSILFLFLASTQDGFACMGDTRCHDSVEATKRLWVWISVWDPQSGRESSSARRWVHWGGSFMLFCLIFASYQLFPFLRGPAGSHKEKHNQSSKCFCPPEPETTCLFSSKWELVG